MIKFPKLDPRTLSTEDLKSIISTLKEILKPENVNGRYKTFFAQESDTYSNAVRNKELLESELLRRMRALN